MQLLCAGFTCRGKDLNQILGEIEKIYNPVATERVIATPSKGQVESFVKDFNLLKAQGFVFRDHDLEELQVC